MKLFKLVFLLILINSNSLIAQKKEEQIIKQVKFEKDKVFMNDQLAFNYSIDNKNHFILSDINKNEIITGDITSSGDGKWSSVITFVQEKKQFSNSKIIGRNDLLFKFLENNVITNDFKINPEKLNAFFDKYNELK
ncbi:hypothetical protein NAT51_04140 [Flavobacterium amniphilum]|uniref:hypothetical protein n=1 Tax=Flavobacterium amniphilum TaxID=1834035 RepID=UPI002029FDD6|nr:hypothetical protein [Flavobacterium amniphilum]MCL9804698.1 hypothetical protein [Flavobacterium amniphilum]